VRISSTRQRNGSSPRAKETVIVFSVAGNTFALAASAIDEVREIEGLKDFQSRIPKVRHTLNRQGRQYFVVDSARHFHLTGATPGRLMILRKLPVALIVDAIDRMQEIQSIQALPDGFIGEERNWYRGLAVLNGDVVPVVHPEGFLGKAEITLLSAALRAKDSARAMAVIA
jgi:chemotaxis signal transduction protein